MIRLVVLDMAGTTVDEGGAVYVALHDAVAADRLNVGSEVTEAAVQEWMGTEKRTAIRALTERASGTVPDQDAVERMYVDFRARLSKAYRDTPPVPVAGTEAMFAELRRRGIRVALTTGFGRDIAEPLLEQLGWTVGTDSTDSTIDAVVCGDEVAAGRPAPFLVFRAMERTGTESVDEVLVGGDTVVDLQAGTNAGARVVVGVTTGKLGFAELAVERHTHLLDSVAGIPALVDRL
ncbi:MAG: phosphonatase-like hydrolase [Acidimicrobiales bacterium]